MDEKKDETSQMSCNQYDNCCVCFHLSSCLNAYKNARLRDYFGVGWKVKWDANYFPASEAQLIDRIKRIRDPSDPIRQKMMLALNKLLAADRKKEEDDSDEAPN